MRRHVGRVIGRGISPVVEALDIDAIVHQIDLQDLLEQVDINEVLSRVDLNDVLDKVDLNRQLERVDMNRLLANVDVNAIIERSDLEKIIARSSTGFITKFLHLGRTRVAIVDQWLQRFGRCACCSKDPWLPPRPSGILKLHKQPRKSWPKNSNEFGKSVQFRCCGLFVRSVAWITDNLLIAISFSIISWIVVKVMDQFSDPEEDPVPTNTSAWWYGGAFFLFEYCYTAIFIGCTGRTIGMSMLGLLVVNKDGRRIGPFQTLFRTLMEPVSTIFFGWVPGLVRRDGRHLVDFLACTCVVYAWDISAAYSVVSNNDFATSIGDFDESMPMLEKDLEEPSNVDSEIFKHADTDDRQKAF